METLVETLVETVTGTLVGGERILFSAESFFCSRFKTDRIVNLFLRHTSACVRTSSTHADTCTRGRIVRIDMHIEPENLKANLEKKIFVCCVLFRV